MIEIIDYILNDFASSFTKLFPLTQLYPSKFAFKTTQPMMIEIIDYILRLTTLNLLLNTFLYPSYTPHILI